MCVCVCVCVCVCLYVCLYVFEWVKAMYFSKKIQIIFSNDFFP